jgi:FkbM family methyltransferase
MKDYSQSGEQAAILNYIETKGLNQGKLLEIGAFDGENFSNVRAVMLKYPNWKGVFVEPSSFCFIRLYEMYKMEPSRAELVNIAVVPDSDLDGNAFLKFNESPMSAVSSSVDGHTERWYNEKNEKGESVNPRRIYVAKTGMKDLLDKFGPFDFINIDVEGYSARLALQDWFNPRDYGCKLLCIEQDGQWRELQDKFVRQGYSMIKLNAENLIMGIL